MWYIQYDHTVNELIVLCQIILAWYGNHFLLPERRYGLGSVILPITVILHFLLLCNSIFCYFNSVVDTVVDTSSLTGRTVLLKYI